jgi:hypothetical protein
VFPGEMGVPRRVSEGLEAWRSVVPLSLRGAEQSASVEVGCSVPLFFGLVTQNNTRPTRCVANAHTHMKTLINEK